MPPKRDITKYSSYFTLEVPNSIPQIVLIILIGMVAGGIASVITHHPAGIDLPNILLLGAISGMLVISFPALLTVLTIRLMRRDMKTKHALFAVLAVTISYSLFIIADAAIFSWLRNNVIAYVILLLVNASLYGYWFIINKIAVGQKKSAIFTAEIQPIFNLIMYFPFGGYLLQLDVPIGIALIKLFFGMLIFLVMGYIIVYLLDRPAKKNLSVSSVELFSAMIGDWLYDISHDAKVLGTGGVRRDVTVDIAQLSSNGKTKAIFIKPDIHYGPFGNIGGSVFTESLGNMVVSRLNATPFIIHGAVNIEDNPMSTSEVQSLSRRICDTASKSASTKDAYGYMRTASEGPCRAVNLNINGLSFLTLSKAPFVTEDIDRQVGLDFEKISDRNSSGTILIDAHNTRFESASPDELKGIYPGSKYVGLYEKAIKAATAPGKAAKLSFGSSYMKLSRVVDNPDIGPGYTSIGIFAFGKRRFGMLYIDANNILPGFRGAIIEHVKAEYGLDIELYSTDTHAVNSIALSAKNCLGRYTSPKEIIPAVDSMIERALKDITPVQFSKTQVVYQGFRVWGKGSEELLNKVGMDIIRTGKRVVPFVIAAAYIAAAWIIYII